MRAGGVPFSSQRREESMGIRSPSRKGLTSSVVLTLLLCGVHHAGAVPVLDQSFDPQNPLFLLGTASEGNSAQTFTVGIEGILSRVDVLVEKNGPFPELRLDVRPTMDGLPIEDDNAVLASVTVPLEAIPSPRAFLSFDVSSFRVLVSPGELLAIVLTGNARWYGVAPGIGTPGLVEVLAEPADDPYPRGAAYFRRPPEAPTFDLPGGGRLVADLGFRTYVDVIPEPPTLMLFGIGVFGLMLSRLVHYGRRAKHRWNAVPARRSNAAVAPRRRQEDARRS
jgi:hypothetical protein